MRACVQDVASYHLFDKSHCLSPILPLFFLPLFPLIFLQRRLKAKLIELSDEKRKNQLLERDVERFRKRQAHLKTISYLKKKKCWVVSQFV